MSPTGNMSPDRSPATLSRAFELGDGSGPGEARRAAAALADRLGFSETERGELALIVTELATNLVRHGGGGTLILRPFPPGGLHGPESGLEVLTLDRGPGMADVGRCLADGYSTAGSAGKGLGAVARLADLFEIHSEPGVGTAALARVYLGPPPLPETLRIGAVHLPMPGEEVCGDAWAVDERPDRRRLLVVDGLGHGQFAAEASGEAVRVFRERADLPLEELVHALHAALRSTRGAALAIAEHDLSDGGSAGRRRVGVRRARRRTAVRRGRQHRRAVARPGGRLREKPRLPQRDGRGETPPGAAVRLSLAAGGAAGDALRRPRLRLAARGEAGLDAASPGVDRGRAVPRPRPRPRRRDRRRPPRHGPPRHGPPRRRRRG